MSATGAAPSPPAWLAAGVAAVDGANAEDPNVLLVDGEPRPKAQAEGQLVAGSMRRLDPDASPALVLAAHAHQLRRWTSPRASYPDGRAGYLRWRRDLHDVHAREAATVLAAAGVPDDVVARVLDLVRKRHLATDAEVQTLEDAICLVFLETQLDDFVDRLDGDRVVQV